MSYTYMKDADGFVFQTERTEYHPQARKLSKAEGMRLKRDQSAAKLREILKPGQRVFCILRSVSKSGMSRRISFYAVKDGEMRFLDGYIADILSSVTRDRKEGLRVSGCGMDMGFHVVYSLSSALFDDGYALKHEWL